MSRDLGLVIRFNLTLGTFLTAFYRFRFLCLTGINLDFSSHRGIENLNKSLIISSRILGVGAIFGGMFCQNFCQEINFFVFVPRPLKIRILLRVLLGAAVRVLVFTLKQNSLKKISVRTFNKLFQDMSRKIWFLPIMRGSFLRLPLLKRRVKSLVTLDSG